MTKLTSFIQQHRHSIGTHTARKDKKAGPQRQQDTRARRLAEQPGRHGGNHLRQDTAHAAVMLLAGLTTVSSSNRTPAITRQRAENMSAENHLRRADFQATDRAVREGIRSGAREVPVHNAGQRTPSVATHSPAQHLGGGRSLSRLLPKNIQPAPQRNATQLRLNQYVSAISLPVASPQFRGSMPLSDYRNRVVRAVPGQQGRSKKTALSGARINLNMAQLNDFAADANGTAVPALVHHWLLHRVLGTDIETWLTDALAGSDNPGAYRVKDLGNALAAATVFPRTVTPSASPQLKKKWQQVVQEAIPLLALAEAGAMRLRDCEWGYAHAGALYLKWAGAEDITPDAAAFTGRLLFAAINADAVPAAIDAAHFFTLPAAINQVMEAAKTGATSAQADSGERAIKALFNKYHRHNKNNVFDRFYAAEKRWQTRREIAESLAKNICSDDKSALCYTADQFMRNNFGTSGILSDRHSPPANPLNQRYKELTQKVADAYADKARLLITTALGQYAEVDELNFIHTATVRQASAELSRNAPLSGGAPRGSVTTLKGKTSVLRPDVNLFAADKNGQQRIYALKAGDDGYSLHRVDRDRGDYCWLDLLTTCPEEGAQQEWTLRVYITEIIKSPIQGHETLVAWLVKAHREQFYSARYNAGYEKTRNEEIRDFLPSLIPFYNCAEHIRDGNKAAAALNCGLDAITLIPALGQMATLSSKFAASAAIGLDQLARVALSHATRDALQNRLLRQSIAQAGRSALRSIAIPDKDELRSVGISLARAVDPGAELAARFLTAVAKRTRFLPEDIKRIVAQLEDKTGAGSGYQKISQRPRRPDDKLSAINVNCIRPRRGLDALCGPPSHRAQVRFSGEQLALIDRLSVSHDATKTYTQTRNLNPHWYGMGLVYEVRNIGEDLRSAPYQRMVEIGNRLIPAAINIIPKHGIVYEAFLSETGERYPLICREGAWSFEPPTDPGISGALEKMITLGRYEKAPQNSVISVPGIRGIRWDADEASWIKVNGDYIRIYGIDAGDSEAYIRAENGKKWTVNIQDARFYPDKPPFKSPPPDVINLYPQREEAVRPAGAETLFKETSTLAERQSGFEQIVTDITRRTDLDRANLRGITVAEEQNMTGFMLRQSQLVDAKMAGVTLVKANLDGANLQNVELSDADLFQATLVNADLRGAKLARADFSQANLWGANLKEAQLEGTDLRAAYLPGADLSRANLRDARLDTADLHNAIMEEALLKKADLTGANLAGATLAHSCASSANFYAANLNGADLYQAKLKLANLVTAKMRGARLVGANLTGARLISADLTGADLTNAVLHNVKISGAILQDARLLNTQITLKLPHLWTPGLVDYYVNHLNNYESGSILTAIDSIDQQYVPLKTQLAGQLVTALRNGNIDISGVHEALIDILSQEPYRRDPIIAEFMQDIYRAYITKYNSAILASNSANVISAALHFFNVHPSLTTDAKFNNAFIQSIHCAMEIPALKAPAITLYNRYLEQDVIRNLLIKPDIMDNFGNYNGKPDWTDAHAQNYILLSPLNNQRVMMLSPSIFSTMRIPIKDTQWNHFFLYQDGNSLEYGEYSLSETLKHDFPLFAAPYNYAAQSVIFRKLLDTLELNDRLYKIFVAATGRVTSAIKLIGTADKHELETLFNQRLDFDKDAMPLLRPDHYAQIISAWDLSGASQRDKAATLLSLSAVFTRYSSSAHFGSEMDSPYALRNYAAALLGKARELSPGILGDPDRFTQWNNKLLGRGECTFTCSAVLSNEMIGEVKARFPAILQGILPPAWN